MPCARPDHRKQVYRENDGGRQTHVLSFVLAVILVCVALGIVGWVVHGLFWLFVIAVILFLVTAVGTGYRGGRRSTRRL